MNKIMNAWSFQEKYHQKIQRKLSKKLRFSVPKYESSQNTGCKSKKNIHHTTYNCRTLPRYYSKDLNVPVSISLLILLAHKWNWIPRYMFWQFERLAGSPQEASVLSVCLLFTYVLYIYSRASLVRYPYKC